MIPSSKPSIGEAELRALAKTFKTGWLALGPRTEEFEVEFARYIGVKHAVGVNSCTAAMDMALKVYEIHSGEVLVPAITFVSTAHAALYNNAKPVFVDNDEKTLCIDVEDLKEKITDKSRAIMAVHLGGHPCDMTPIMELAEEKGLIVIEDAAAAAGAEYKGRKVGSIGHVGCFSFENKKNLTIGEGGMFTTNDAKIADRVKRLRRFGMSKPGSLVNYLHSGSLDDTAQYPGYYEVTEVGFKNNMNDVQATIGLVQLKKLDRMNNRRRAIADYYTKKLSKLGWLEPPKEEPWGKSVWCHYDVRMDRRNEFMSYMTKKGILTTVRYMPVHLHPVYKDYRDAKVPKAERVWKRLVGLPVFPDLSRRQQDQIVTAVKGFQ
jgi:perosamine synthetase